MAEKIAADQQTNFLKSAQERLASLLRLKLLQEEVTFERDFSHGHARCHAALSCIPKWHASQIAGIDEFRIQRGISVFRCR